MQHRTLALSDTMTRRSLLLGAGAGVAAFAVLGPQALTVAQRSGPEEFDADVPTTWFDLALRLVRDTPGFSPPVAARAFGYAGVALYEAVVPRAIEHRSLVSALPGLDSLPQAPGNLPWPAVANAALATTFRTLFANSPDAAAIDALEATLADFAGRGVGHGIRRRAHEQGAAIGAAIVAWSRSDGSLGPADRYQPLAGAGLWVPTPPGFLPALLPGWGRNRCFTIPAATVCAAPAHTPYSEDTSSTFFAEAVEVYDAVANLTDEQRAVAEFWSDDPGRTATPPGHSIAVASQVLRSEQASLITAAETYARVGLAVADAFVVCWHTKYQTNLLRPVTYIQRLIDPDWLPPLVTPPFPEYTSGHSVQSGAAFDVLTDLYGDRYAFDDRTHEARGLGVRRFESFAAAAAEAGISRLYGGIHYRPAIDHGLDQGRCIGAAVNALPWRTSRTDRPRPRPG